MTLVPVNRTASQCVDCLKVFPNSQLKYGSCKDCRDVRRERMAVELQMSDQRNTSELSRELLSRIKKAGSDQQVLDQVFAKFIEMQGGTGGLAEKLSTDFEKVRGVNLNPREQALFERKDSVIVKYWQMIMGHQEKLDERNNVDASGLTDDDLQATLAQLAARMMVDDPEFRMRVMSNVAIARSPIDVTLPANPAVPEEDPSWEEEES